VKKGMLRNNIYRNQICISLDERKQSARCVNTDIIEKRKIKDYIMKHNF
jgi:hypothetical protein